MINSINWHENNLKNQKKYHYNLFKEIQSLQNKYDADSKKIDFYEKQINTAFSKGKNFFDRDKFLVKRKNRKSKNL